MKNTCRACDLPPSDRAALDAALRSGEPLLTLAKRFGLSESATRRHRDAHLARSGDVLPPEEPEPVDETLAELGTLQKITRSILARALQNESDEIGLKAVREASRLLRQQAELTGKVSRAKLTMHVDLRLDSTFTEISRAAARALRDFPEARRALSDELGKLRRRTR